MPLSLSTAPIAQSISRQETPPMQIPMGNQPYSALALPFIPGWPSILAFATLAFAFLYSLYSLDAHFRHRRQGRQDGIVEISRPANPKFELANPLHLSLQPTNGCPASLQSMVSALIQSLHGPGDFRRRSLKIWYSL